MLEFRISGETAEVCCLADQIEGAGYVVKRSKLYQNRDEESCRIYLEWMRSRSWTGCLPTLKKHP